MLELYLLSAGVYLYYSKSKYAPDFIMRLPKATALWLANILLAVGTIVYVYNYGWASGLLLTIAAMSLAATVLPFFAVLGKHYFYGLALVMHSLLIVDLISYAR